MCTETENGRFCVVNYSGRYLNARKVTTSCADMVSLQEMLGRTKVGPFFFWWERIDLPFRGDRVERDGISTKLITIRKAIVEARHDKLQRSSCKILPDIISNCILL
jgi:hypothetical protein